MPVKQVIVMRAKFPDGKGGTFSLRKGKSIAQGSHASMMWLTNRIREPKGLWRKLLNWLFGLRVKLSSEEAEWVNGTFTKVTLQVDTEEELKAVYEKAIAQKLMTYMVVDSGKTEFGGVPTITAIAIGPNKAEDIDVVTSNLKLF